MVHRIEVAAIVPDARAAVRKKQLAHAGFSVNNVEIVDVYTIDATLDDRTLDTITGMLANPVTQQASVAQIPSSFDWALEIGFLPGVTDNLGSTAKETIEDRLKQPLHTYSSQITYLSGDLSRTDVERIATSLANPLIQRIHIKNRTEATNGMDAIVPRVHLDTKPAADIVDLLNIGDDELIAIGKQGIRNKDGTRRGPLALDITYMKTIQAYFKKNGRNPTDVELESIAQTWSEHCKHTIFADQLDDITDGLYHHFIKAATNEIRKQKGAKDFCVSVFTDNAGGIIFDENYLVTDKVETHNSPSALDPFGGSITGIVGVNRDAIGFGMGAKPIANRYGFCFADPNDNAPLYKGANKTQQMLSPKAIMDGVIQGVNVGGNCSGIPTPQGFMLFDERYKGKPLVYVGTLGLIPRSVRDAPSHEKAAQAGDFIVMVGGRVGKDGIHGATFSSEALDSGSPATAVQIGDPITQKKLSDAIVKEARDLGLYTSITDNGAGGLSCSVAEMAKECGGAFVRLDQVPVKYSGLAPWEIWISESQERMTLSVPKEKWDAFNTLMQWRGVEATVIGEFTNNKRCFVDYLGKTVMDIEMDFLHDGLPKRALESIVTHSIHEEPQLSVTKELTSRVHEMLGRKNIASTAFISRQYDHEVQGTSVLKPLQGRGQVNGDATVIKPVRSSPKGVVLSHGLTPSYSDIDAYDMAAASIDTAIRNAIAAGAKLDYLALLDNFCWCSSNDKERLGQLKEAVRACYDVAVAYGTPFISGKDSMFNDFKGYDAQGNKTLISIPPTLLISSIGIIDDAMKSISLDAKCAGDIVYLLGETKDELGGSEYFAMMGEKVQGKAFIGNKVPKVDVARNKQMYECLSIAAEQGLIASAQGVNRGGLAVALAKTAMGGLLGMDITSEAGNEYKLFSESQGRVLVTVHPSKESAFQEIMGGTAREFMGIIRADDKFTINDSVNTTVPQLLSAYRKTFEANE